MVELEIVSLKVLAILALVGLACLGGWFAYRLTRLHGGTRRWSAHANAAAGGFLLGAGLFHFLPESHAHFAWLYPDHRFPYGFTFCAIGFAGILALERMLFDPEAHALDDKGDKGAALVLAIALSIHALLAGMAVGSEKDAMSIFAVTAALGAHKFAAAFTLGSSLVGAGIRPGRYRAIIVAFSASTPIGILLGGFVVLLLNARQLQWFEGVFDGMAAGTFLYIAALDVIHQEFFHRRASWLSMFLFVAALAFMLLISLAD